MKSTTLRILALGTFALAASYALETSLGKPTGTTKTKPTSTSSDSRNASRPVQKMKDQADRIHHRLQMSAPLDASETTDPVTGIDAIQELYDSGFIIPATLEEVEAAIEAAKLTPEIEDDQAAAELCHRGSYRFFLNN